MDESFTAPNLDPSDMRLLDALQNDASLTNHALAAKVGTSPATCLRRVKRLADAGFIERRVALLSAARLGLSLTAIAEVSLDHQGADAQAAFEARAVAEPFVRQCYRVSSGPDFVIVIQVADMAAYHALVQRLFTEDANVRNVKAFFSTHQAKFDTRIALPDAGAVPDDRRARRAGDATL